LVVGGRWMKEGKAWGRAQGRVWQEEAGNQVWRKTRIPSLAAPGHHQPR
jgi:hypothetical protein